jgi:Ca2+-binding RTX toxin-like protein
MSEISGSTSGLEVLDGGIGGGNLVLGEDATGNNIIRPTLTGVTEVRGQGGDDVITPGPANPDATLFALGGDDLVIGGTGDNELFGNEGNDTIYGLEGDDALYGGQGDDALYGGEGDDRVQGDDGNDTLAGGGGNDSLFGGEGDDLLSGGDGDDVLYGNEGNDTLQGDAGSDTMFGGQGNDTLQGGDGGDSLLGDKGNDRLNGGEGTDTYAFTFAGGSDADTIVAFESGETIALGGDVFDALGGDVEAAEFTLVGTDAERGDADTPLVYVQETGELYFDGQLVATILNNPDLSAGDFEVF